MRGLIIFLAIVGVAFGVYLGVHHSSRRHAAVISRCPRCAAAPELSLTDLNGNTLRTANYKDKVVLVNFWAAWCTFLARKKCRNSLLCRKNIRTRDCR